MNNLDDLYTTQALGFIHRHNGAHLSRGDLVRRVIDYLQTGFDISNETAERCAVRALCEFDSDTSLYVDVDNTTATMIAIRDTRRKVTRVLSIGDIARLLATAELAPVRTPSYSEAMAGRNIPYSDAPLMQHVREAS